MDVRVGLRQPADRLPICRHILQYTSGIAAMHVHIQLSKTKVLIAVEHTYLQLSMDVVDFIGKDCCD